MIYTITNPEIIKAICPTGGSTLTVECDRTEKTTGKISVDEKPALTVDHKWLKDFRAGLKRLTVREPDYSYKYPREAEKKLAAWKAGKIEAFREKVELPAELWPEMGTEKPAPKNPASYTAASLELIAGKIQKLRKLKGQSEIIILDPMAGSGKAVMLQELTEGLNFLFLLNDLEKWAHYESRAAVIWTHDDAAALRLPDDSVDLIVTSPTYGNRMADSHNARDTSDRITYTHRLGKPLKDGNTGKMPYGKSYLNKHADIFKECFRVMKPGGTGFFVVADFIRQGKRVHVTDFIVQSLKASGFSVTATFEIEMRGMRKGRNGNLRVGFETVIQCEKREKKK